MVGLFQISQKERFFRHDNQLFLGIISQCGSPCTLPKRAFLSPSVWARRKYIWKLSQIESWLICFENYQGVPCSHRQSRNMMMNSFIIVNITPYAIDSLEDKSMLALFKQAFPPTSLGQLLERRAYCFVLKATRVLPIPTQAE